MNLVKGNSIVGDNARGRTSMSRPCRATHIWWLLTNSGVRRSSMTPTAANNTSQSALHGHKRYPTKHRDNKPNAQPGVKAVVIDTKRRNPCCYLPSKTTRSTKPRTCLVWYPFKYTRTHFQGCLWIQ